MIGKLKGQIELIDTNHLIIDANGVGYIVFCSSTTLDRLSPGGYVELFIETHVREDAINLYGFEHADEKSTFNIFISVKGVGMKMALSILSQLDLNTIQIALTTEDNAIFQQISGIGQKLATRIITELKDKVICSNQSILHSTRDIIDHNSRSSSSSIKANDAISALVNLGINKIDAFNKVNALLKIIPDISVSELIKQSLQKR